MTARSSMLAWMRHRAVAFLASTALAALLLVLNAAGAWAAVPANGRAWELVTSPDPNGVPATSTLAIDPTGGRIAFVTVGPAPGAVAGTVAATNMAVRGPAGWNSAPVGHPYSTPTLTFRIPFAVGASKDLSTWIWSSATPLLSGAPEYPGSGVYRATVGGPLTLLGEGGDTDSQFALAGVSDDAQRLVFQTPTQILPADAARTGASQVYEYVGSTLKVVGVDSGGALLSACGATVGSTSAPPRPVSRDGKRIFLTSRPPDCGGATERVYLRRDEATTTEISASQCTRVDCDAAADVRFMGATPDGATAFLATPQQLTNDDVDESRDLYRYDVAGGTLSRVSVSSPAVDADVIATRAYPSDDGSRVYFLANGALVAGQGTAASPNLYVADGDGVRFVATLGPFDDWPTGATSQAALEEVAVTPGSGRRLMFVTTAALTADDTDSSRDVYLYDADDDELVRVSGVPGTGNGAFGVEASLADDLLIYPPFPTDAPSALSRDGRRVFFTTAESLLPADVDDAIDVYEWLDGDLGLVSSGTGPDGVLYLGASADGATVFFSTDESLLVSDDDGGDHDLYAARIGGGFPEAAPPAGCAAGACPPPPPYGRLSRPDPATIAGAGSERHARLVVRRPGRSALRRMVAGGRLTLVLSVPRPGRVSARARARIGHRVWTVARGRAKAAHAGRLSLRLRLSPAARRRLAAGGTLRMRVVVREWRLGTGSTLRLTLEGAK